MDWRSERMKAQRPLIAACLFAAMSLLGAWLGWRAVFGGQGTSAAFDVSPDGKRLLVCRETGVCRWLTPADGSWTEASFRLWRPAIHPDGRVFGLRTVAPSGIDVVPPGENALFFSAFPGSGSFASIALTEEGRLVALRSGRARTMSMGGRGLDDLSIVAFSGEEASPLTKDRFYRIGLTPGGAALGRIYFVGDKFSEPARIYSVAITGAGGIKPLPSRADSGSARLGALCVDGPSRSIAYTTWGPSSFRDVWVSDLKVRGERKLFGTRHHIEQIRFLDRGRRLAVLLMTEPATYVVRIYDVAGGALVREYAVPGSGV